MEVVDTKDDLASPLSVFQQTPEEAVGVANESPHSGCPRPSNTFIRHERSNSFQRWKRQMQKAWKWAPNVREQISKSAFNPEVLANQKRQWYQLHSRTKGLKQHTEPTSLFEQFFIVGLHSDANVEALEDAFARKKIWESEMAKSEILDLRKLQYRGPPLPTLQPQILFKYPPRKRITMRLNDLPAFCFPGGIKAHLMERTPSMSDLNEVIYGQEHMCRDDLSFIFSLKVADNSTLYGVCLHVQEIVQRPPGILGVVSPLSHSSGRGSRFLVSAPRCYCLLTRVPFFELHYEMLNSIIAQERLDRITQFVSEISLTDLAPPLVRTQDQMNENYDCSDQESSTDWTASAIPVESMLSLTAAAAGLISDSEVNSFSFRQLEPQSPQRVSPSEASELSQEREPDKDTRRCLQYFDDYASETSGSRSDSFERINESYENGLTSPECGTLNCSVSRKLERVGSSDSMFSSVKSMGSDDDDVDEVSSNHEMIAPDEKERKNDLLQIVCGYHALPLPPRGGEIIFQPLDHLQPIKYSRPGLSALGLSGSYADIELCSSSLEVAQVNARLAVAEEAFSLSIWTTATVCRALSLESVLALFTGALLEKQVLVVCPNLGILSATVLSVIPIIRPFEWQSLLLPVLPRKMLDFLDAPVPYIVGIQHKPADMKLKTSNLIRINVYKDEVKMSSLPQLPRHRELVAELGPIHARLSCENSIAKRHPVYKCSEVQAEAAGHFLNVMRCYLESLCSNLRSHTITSVQSNNDRVSLLLKDSFIDSFPSRDRSFVKLFVDTQLFSVLSDSRLSRYENE
ncbi:DENN (AEX-3) domain-containing protein isoform X2 [Tasmannia lanceolata]|uniref:DENN (AEX-3) domain-containing protein isoform X2 n=1 Tax=Tasmannia lanceolata TaxID=3420 RepID=UPI00406475C4